VRIAAKVNASQDQNPNILFQIEKAIWKAPQRCAPHPSLHYLIEPGRLGHESLYALHLSEERCRQPSSFAFVLSRRIDNLAAS
jgi:hypothetical protein